MIYNKPIEEVSVLVIKGTPSNRNMQLEKCFQTDLPSLFNAGKIIL